MRLQKNGILPKESVDHVEVVMNFLERPTMKWGKGSPKAGHEPEVLFDDTEASQAGLHPMVESDQETAARLAAAGTGGEQEARYVSQEEVERLLRDPGLDVTAHIPEDRAVAMSPDLVNPGQYGSGVPLAIRELPHTPVEQNRQGLDDLRINPGQLEEVLDAPALTTSSLEASILADKYRTPHMRAQRLPTPESTGLAELQQRPTERDRRKALDDDWKRTQEIVRAQQAAAAPARVLGQSASISGPVFESDVALERRMASGRDPAGLGRYQSAPLHERMGERGLYSQKELTLREQGLRIIFDLRKKLAEHRREEAATMSLELDIAQLERELAVETDGNKKLAQQRVLKNFLAERTNAVATEDVLRWEGQLATAEAVFQKTFGNVPDEGAVSRSPVL